MSASPNDLNERQRAYLLAAYCEDQRREESNRYPGGPPAREWRWIEYGPVGAKYLDGGRFLLRQELLRNGVPIDAGTGATWSSLSTRRLIETRYENTGLERAGRPIVSLLVRLTRAGRIAARALRGDPPRRPREVKPLCLSALRLIAYGQQHPSSKFEWRSPWDERGFQYPNFQMMLGVARGLIKRGLLAGEAPCDLHITDVGLSFDVTAEPEWRPMREPRT